MSRFIGFKVFAILMLMAFSAVAQSQKDLQVTMEVKKVVKTADGKESLEPADQAKPGDVLQYTAVYANKSKNTLRDLEATIPVPPYTEYVPGSSRPAGAKASVDGQSFQSIPLRRKVKQADGKEVMQLVPYADYRTLRWFAGNLSANQELKFSTRVKVLSNDAAAPPSAEKSGEGEKK
jgi:uncharacterized repeat protein (TIGR01451 family)